eukprot:948711_1
MILQLQLQRRLLKNIGMVDDITTGYEKKGIVKENWDDGMYNQLLEFKQKHGHVKVPCDCGNENGKLGRWVINRRRDYREYKRTYGQKGDPERMKSRKHSSGKYRSG